MKKLIKPIMNPWHSNARAARAPGFLQGWNGFCLDRLWLLCQLNFKSFGRPIQGAGESRGLGELVFPRHARRLLTAFCMEALGLRRPYEGSIPRPVK
jgi:hypothetical protein